MPDRFITDGKIMNVNQLMFDLDLLEVRNFNFFQRKYISGTVQYPNYAQNFNLRVNLWSCKFF